jgi:hypothetical protein
MRTSLAVLTALSLAACGGSSKAPAAPAPPPAAAPLTGTLTGLENGDRACYVALDLDGAAQSIEGDFELCAGGSKDATALIGQRVVVTRERANVLAASCEGDVDCGKSDAVDLVVSITAAP